MPSNLKGADAVWQVHADLAAEKGILACELCKHEPVSATVSMEDGDTFVGEACYQEWRLRDHSGRVVPL